MLNQVIRFFRKILNREFYSDVYVKVDPQHERDSEFANGPINW